MSHNTQSLKNFRIKTQPKSLTKTPIKEQPQVSKQNASSRKEIKTNKNTNHISKTTVTQKQSSKFTGGKQSMRNLNGTKTPDRLLKEKNKYLRYDQALYQKTIFHLKPVKENPQLFMRSTNRGNFSGIAPSKARNYQNDGNGQYMKNSSILPCSINVRQGLTRLTGKQDTLEKLLDQNNKVLVTAKKWILYDAEEKLLIKGFKHRKEHDIASLTKLMTFYTAYSIIQKYFLSLEKLDLIADQEDELIQGTKINLKAESLVNLSQMLYAMMLNSANNAATVIANNLGSLIRKKKNNQYFSCFDVLSQSRQQNMAIFVELMNSHAEQLAMCDSKYYNAHGMAKNISSALDVAKLLSQCCKIPLFCKIVNTAKHRIDIRYVSEDGELVERPCLLENTNKLIQMGTGCIGGKTGCNSVGGQSLAALYEGNVIVVVLGSLGREQKFADCQRLINWLKKRSAELADQELLKSS